MKTTVLFVDSNVTDYEVLLASLADDVEVYLLNAEDDGVLQMADILKGRTDLDSIQIISHGSSGALALGSGFLNNDNLSFYADALGQIGSALSATGDILLYGCNVAQGDLGQQFINQLGVLTGADVAASSDLTGNAALGGDWDLEVSAGTIETSALALMDMKLVLNLADGIEDTPYIVKESDLLAGFAVVGGQVLSAVNVMSDGILLEDNLDSTFTYTPDLDYNGSVVLTYDVADLVAGGGNIATAVTQSFNLAAVNDAPILTEPTAIDYINTALVDNFVTVTGLLAGSDVDAGATITYGITGGTTTSTTVSKSNAYGTLTVTKATGAYSFVPDSAAMDALSVDGTSSFTVTASDGLLTTSQLLTINLTLLDPTPNTPPAGTDNTITINDVGSYTLTAADFGFSDVDHNNFAAVKISSLPQTTAGSLLLNGSVVAANSTVSISEINLGHLTFALSNGNGYASMKFQVQDDGGGTNIDVTPNTLKFATQEFKHLLDLGLNILDTPEVVAPGLTLIATGLDPSLVHVNEPFNSSSAVTTNTYSTVLNATLGSTNYFGTGPLLTGAGVTVGVWDATHVRATHQEFKVGTGASRVTFGDTGTAPLDDHSTHVAGTIGGDGDVPLARGMAPGVLIRSYDWTNDLISELNTAAASGLLLSNHSYGFANGWHGLINVAGVPTDWWLENRTNFSIEDPDFGRYSAETKALDTILNANKNLLSVWAAGNDRDDHYTNANAGKYVAWLSAPTVTSPAWYLINAAALTAPPADGNAGAGYDSLPEVQTAKNSLVVGAVNDLEATAPFSNWGPTDDGRLGVSLMANGVNVYSAIAASDTAYGTMSGTSMAAPNVTGSIALLEELHNLLSADLEYKNVQHIGWPGTGTQPRFLDTVGPITPTSATMKGLVLHTASELNTVGPDFQTGYGLLNAKAAGDFLNGLKNSYLSNKYLLAEDTYHTGNAAKFGEVNYSGNTNGIKVTLVWNDAAPTVLPPRGINDTTIDNATKVLVNDLDLYVKGPDGKFYYPWHLDPTNPGAAATSPTSMTHTAADIAANGDHLNNVEQIFIPQISSSTVTAAGKYEVFVDGLLATGQTAQDFSIFFTSTPAFGEGHGWGDVHIKLFDDVLPDNPHSTTYNFQSVGEFVMIESTTDDWQIQTRQEKLVSNTAVSVNTAFATTMSGYKVVFDLDNLTDKKITIDGTAVTLLNNNSLAIGANSIVRSGNVYTLTWAGADGVLGTADDDSVTATDGSNYINIDVKPADYRAGSVRGLMGNGDGDVSNDFTLRDGTLLSATTPTVTQIHNDWANSWLVNAAGTGGHAQSLFSTTTAFVANDPSNSPALNPAALAAAKVLVQNAAIAVGGITNAKVLDAIAFDFVATGDDQRFIDSGVAFFAQSVTLSVSPATVTEGSVTKMVYTFTRTGNFANAVTVNYAIDGTATFNSDYSQTGATLFDGTTGKVSFAVGSATATVSLTAKADAVVDPNETVKLWLTQGTNYTVGTTVKVLGTILDGVIVANTAPVLTTPAAINYIDTAFVDTFAEINGTLVGSDVDAGTTLSYGITGGIDNGTTVSKTIAYGTLTVNKTTGAYSFAPTNAAIEPLGALVTTTLTVTVSDGSLISSKALGVTITQSGVTETIGNDNLVGTVGNDTFNALAGNDVINGGLGADTMRGGLGNDTYIVGTGDTVIELASGGIDTVKSSVTYTLGVNVENLTLTGTAANGTGNVLNNIIIGNTVNNVLNGGAGNDTMTGGAGADTMIGGAGNDTYIVDNIGDVVTELAAGGIDTVKSSVTYTLGANVENLTLTGTSAINGTGNALNNVIIGNSANNVLDGGAGADTMIGGAGNDAYIVDNTGDTVTELASGGIDIVVSSVTYTLGANVENLTLTGTAAINGTGNALNNVIIGNSAANSLNGSSGNDMLNGGTGNDTLTGGLGSDTFLFNTATTTNIDRITDFNTVNDTIKLENAIFTTLIATGVLNADSFFIGTAAHDMTDRIIYNANTGAVLYDSNGSATTGGAVQIALLGANLAITHADFVVI